MADAERWSDKVLEAETPTAEGLRDCERQMEGRRAEIETILDDRTTALTQHVQQAEAAVVRRIRELGERAADNAQALDTKLGEATSERSKELDAFAEHVMQSVDERIAQAVEEASVASESDPRMTKLVVMIAGAHVAIDRVAGRVEALDA